MDWYSLHVLARSTENDGTIAFTIDRDNGASLSATMREVVLSIPAEFEILCITEDENVFNHTINRFTRPAVIEWGAPRSQKHPIKTSEFVLSSR